MNFAADICEAVGRFHFSVSVGRKVGFIVGKGRSKDGLAHPYSYPRVRRVTLLRRRRCGVIFFFTITISELSALEVFSLN